jgi:hypothetical protein
MEPLNEGGMSTLTRGPRPGGNGASCLKVAKEKLRSKTVLHSWSLIRRASNREVRGQKNYFVWSIDYAPFISHPLHLTHHDHASLHRHVLEIRYLRSTKHRLLPTSNTVFACIQAASSLSKSLPFLGFRSQSFVHTPRQLCEARGVF